MIVQIVREASFPHSDVPGKVVHHVEIQGSLDRDYLQKRNSNNEFWTNQAIRYGGLLGSNGFDQMGARGVASQTQEAYKSRVMIFSRLDVVMPAVY